MDVCIHMHIWVCVYMYGSIRVDMYLSMYMCGPVGVSVYLCRCVCVGVCECVVCVCRYVTVCVKGHVCAGVCLCVCLRCSSTRHSPLFQFLILLNHQSPSLTAE